MISPQFFMWSIALPIPFGSLEPMSRMQGNYKIEFHPKESLSLPVFYIFYERAFWAIYSFDYKSALESFLIARYRLRMRRGVARI